MGRTYQGAKRPVTRRSRLLVVRCTQCVRCGVLSHRKKYIAFLKDSIHLTAKITLRFVRIWPIYDVIREQRYTNEFIHQILRIG